jgi:hypothetical protein
MPSTESSAFHGLRTRLRTIMRADADSQRATPERSMMPVQKLAGASGRIASAGASAVTRFTAAIAPAHAPSRLASVAQNSTAGLITSASSGK